VRNCIRALASNHKQVQESRGYSWAWAPPQRTAIADIQIDKENYKKFSQMIEKSRREYPDTPNTRLALQIVSTSLDSRYSEVQDETQKKIDSQSISIDYGRLLLETVAIIVTAWLIQSVLGSTKRRWP